MKTVLNTAPTSPVALSGALGTAAAQDSGYWAEGSISPWGMEMYDDYGNSHFVDPYAYDSQVDIYGNVYSNDYGYMDPQVGMNDLYHTNPYAADTSSSSSYYDTNPYAGATTSHEKFLESIWE